VRSVSFLKNFFMLPRPQHRHLAVAHAGGYEMEAGIVPRYWSQFTAGRLKVMEEYAERLGNGRAVEGFGDVVPDTSGTAGPTYGVVGRALPTIPAPASSPKYWFDPAEKHVRCKYSVEPSSPHAQFAVFCPGLICPAIFPCGVIPTHRPGRSQINSRFVHLHPIRQSRMLIATDLVAS